MLTMGEPSAAHSKLWLWITYTESKVHSGSDALVGCSTGVITDGLAEALFILHQ